LSCRFSTLRDNFERDPRDDEKEKGEEFVEAEEDMNYLGNIVFRHFKQLAVNLEDQPLGEGYKSEAER
jgi:hypothetical protein